MISDDYIADSWPTYLLLHTKIIVQVCRKLIMVIL